MIKIASFMVIYADSHSATFHSAIKAARRAAKREHGELFQRRPDKAPEFCELPGWATTFKDHFSNPYFKV